MNTQKLAQTFAAFGLSFDEAGKAMMKFNTQLHIFNDVSHRSKCVTLARNMAKYPQIKEILWQQFITA